MPKFYKHKLLFDEGLPPRIRFPRLNQRYDVKHIAHDLGQGGTTDKAIYNLAQQEHRLVITLNPKDFAPFIQSNHGTGVIGLSSALSTEQIDIKVTALLARSTEKALYGKLISLTSETVFS